VRRPWELLATDSRELPVLAEVEVAPGGRATVDAR
jgi:hypothetical protein